ncbi:MAG: family 4 glycosyl hydrolase [Planctomycetota bacterium]|jgi:alpha-galactosidase
MSGPKVTVIGAGSYFFGKEIVRKMAVSPVLAGGTLALVDTDKAVLATMARLARRAFRRTKCGVRLLASTARREVMGRSDFVVLSFSHRNAYYRGLDTEIAARHGIRMCSSDTIGPGGVFRALREAPTALDVARDVERLCPRAWLINFVNPTAVLGMALRRYAPRVRSFALCDGNHEPYATLGRLKYVGILPEGAGEVPPDVAAKLDLAVAGVNHCTFLFRFTYDGKDMLPAVRRRLAGEVRAEKESPAVKSKPRYNKAYALALFDIYGAMPTAVSHTKEYVPFFQGNGVRAVRPEPIRLFDAATRGAEMKESWKTTREYASGARSVAAFLREVKDDHASDIIESMWGNMGRPFYINTANRGAVSNLPDDAFLEVRCDIDMNGPRPQPVGELPRGVLSLTHQVLDTHELTAGAAVTGDHRILRRAILTDPICNNIADADACIRDLLEAEREALPSLWFTRKRRRR